MIASALPFCGEDCKMIHARYLAQCLAHVNCYKNMSSVVAVEKVLSSLCKLLGFCVFSLLQVPPATESSSPVDSVFMFVVSFLFSLPLPLF